MQCMEVWGGSGAADNGVSMPGIDAWVFSRPYMGHHEGGDIHYVSSCGTGRISRLMVADISGHGQSVASVAIELRTLMRRFVNTVDQTAFVSMMNKEFAKLAEGGLFATAVVATFWAPTDYLVACNAGHPRPLLYSAKKKLWRFMESDEHERGEKLADPVPFWARRNKQAAIAQPLAQPARASAAGPSNLPLGILDESDYEQTALRMNPGDLCVVYTDSLVEAGPTKANQLGEEGLLKIVRSLDVRDPSTLGRRLHEAVVQRTGGQPLDDDATILVVRANGVHEQYSFFEKLKAQLRFVGKLLWPFGWKNDPAPWPEVSLENLLGPLFPKLEKRLGRGVGEI